MEGIMFRWIRHETYKRAGKVETTYRIYRVKDKALMAICFDQQHVDKLLAVFRS